MQTECFRNNAKTENGTSQVSTDAYCLADLLRTLKQHVRTEQQYPNHTMIFSVVFFSCRILALLSIGSTIHACQIGKFVPPEPCYSYCRKPRMAAFNRCRRRIKRIHFDIWHILKIETRGEYEPIGFCFGKEEYTTNMVSFDQTHYDGIANWMFIFCSSFVATNEFAERHCEAEASKQSPNKSVGKKSKAIQ